MSGQTRTPRTDAYRDSISATEISKHPLREFMGALDFARALEIENAELRQALWDINVDAWTGDASRLRVIARRSDTALSKSKGAE